MVLRESWKACEGGLTAIELIEPQFVVAVTCADGGVLLFTLRGGPIGMCGQQKPWDMAAVPALPAAWAPVPAPSAKICMQRFAAFAADTAGKDGEAHAGDVGSAVATSEVTKASTADSGGEGAAAATKQSAAPSADSTVPCAAHKTRGTDGASAAARTKSRWKPSATHGSTKSKSSAQSGGASEVAPRVPAPLSDECEQAMRAVGLAPNVDVNEWEPAIASFLHRRSEEREKEGRRHHRGMEGGSMNNHGGRGGRGGNGGSGGGSGRGGGVYSACRLSSSASAGACAYGSASRARDRVATLQGVVANQADKASAIEVFAQQTNVHTLLDMHPLAEVGRPPRLDALRRSIATAARDGAARASERAKGGVPNTHADATKVQNGLSDETHAAAGSTAGCSRLLETPRRDVIDLPPPLAKPSRTAVKVENTLSRYDGALAATEAAKERARIEAEQRKRVLQAKDLGLGLRDILAANWMRVIDLFRECAGPLTRSVRKACAPLLLVQLKFLH
eukprot:1169375-Pleurochrysis_carterae.AAC.2